MIKIFSVHEHEIILVNFEKKSFGHKKLDKFEKLNKNDGITYNNLKDVTFMIMKCQKCGSDIKPSKGNYDDEDIQLIQKNYLEYCSNKNKNFVFKLSDYYKIDKKDAIDDTIYLGTKEEIKNFIIKKKIESEFGFAPYRESEKLQKWINFLLEMVEKKEDPKKSISFKLDNFNIIGAYDIILDINSVGNLSSEGWNVKYPKGKEEYERKMKMDSIIIGVIGNRNKGKSFILQKLSGYDIPQGFSVVTEGLSVKYGEEKDHCIAILDSAGKETPLLNPKTKLSNDENDNINNEQTNENKKEKNNYEICLRDKLITETFIQRFIIDISHILILVVGNINLNEQKLLENVKSSLKNDQFLYVIHNLYELNSKEQVNDYINGQLKNLFGIKLKERNFQNNKGNYHQVFYVEEENEKVTHLIYVNEYSTIADYYNTPTIQFLKNKNDAEQRRTKFSVIEACKKYLVEIADQFIEEKIVLDNFESENNDKIKLKDSSKISLKKVFVDEIGKTQTNNFDQPRYSYYTTEKDLIIKVELPGKDAQLKTKMQKGEEFYTFFFEGEKPCEEDVLKEEHKIKKNLKEKYLFKFNLYIPIKDITIGLNDKGKTNFYEKSNKDGIFTFKYHLIIEDESNDFE